MSIYHLLQLPPSKLVPLMIEAGENISRAELSRASEPSKGLMLIVSETAEKHSFPAAVKSRGGGGGSFAEKVLRTFFSNLLVQLNNMFGGWRMSPLAPIGGKYAYYCCHLHLFRGKQTLLGQDVYRR